VLFFDTSALVKAYLNESGTPTVRAVLKRLRSPSLVMTRYVALEVLTTFARQLRSKQIDKRDYNAARTDFLGSAAARFQVIEVSDPILTSAHSLAHQHRQTSVGAMDILHVATALHLESMVRPQPFVVASSDAGFLGLARACGLKTFDPETEPLGTLLAVWR
jgi:predicted nucleic acid-binding protein